MPFAAVNGIDVHYRVAGTGPETIVCVNGLADDLETWAFQEADLTAAGYRLLMFDNRGIGKTSKPAGPYSSRLLADDAKALVDHLGITDFHLLGVSMGGMIVQEYALAYPEDLRSVIMACTYAAPGPFCSRMFAMWADAAPVLGIPFVMRDVTLWAFSTDFFSSRPDELAEFETADATDLVLQPWEWQTVQGGHACLWEHPASFNNAVADFVRRHGKGDLCPRTSAPMAPLTPSRAPEPRP